MPNRTDESHRNALNTALRILTRRDHSARELTQKLQVRGYAGEVIDNIISECERLGYINDERTAQIVIRRLHRKGYGVKHIRFELNRKGLLGKHVEKMLAESISLSDERQAAEKIFLKHMGRFEREKDILKRKDKIYRFLYARGFSQTAISELVGKLR
jgi:regulatory protein